MTYGLVSSPVIGFDLVRHPHGTELARVLRYVVGAGAQHVAVLAALGEDVEAPRRALLGQARGGGTPPAHGRPVAHDASIGGLSDLIVLVQAVVRPQCWDVATGLHRPGRGAEELDPGVRDAAVLAATAAVVETWATGSPDHLVVAAERLVPPDPLPVGPAARALLARLSVASTDEVRALASLADPGGWAVAVHDVCLRLHRDGRTEVAAGAQLEAVQLARHAGMTAEAAHGGAWQVLAGALHAAVAGDLAGRLMQPWSSVMGPLPHHLPPRPRKGG